MIRTSNNTLSKDTPITLSEAVEINLHSAAILYAVAEHFKNKGHKVTLIATSFGAFLALEMYRHYGDDPFQKSIISVGRVDMPEEIYKSFSQNKFASFKDDGKTIQIGMKFEAMLPMMMQQMGGCNPKNPMAAELCKDGKIDDALKKAFLVRRDTASKLQAALGQNRYSKLLASKNLSKIVYYSGAKDTAVGVLTDAEVNFLRKRGATVTIVSNAGHGVHMSRSNEIRTIIESSFKTNILGTYEGTIDAMETKSLVARGGRSLSSIKKLSFTLALGTKNLIVQYRLSRGQDNAVRGSMWFGNKTNRSFEKGFDVIGTLNSTNSTTLITLSANVRGSKISDTLTVQENGILIDSAGNKYRKEQ